MINKPITVAIRVRPFTETDPDEKSMIEIVDNNMIQFDCSNKKRPLGSIGVRRHKNQTYIFDHVFEPFTQTDEVYRSAVQTAIIDVLKGYNTTIFAYGATGSGKSHTMIGNDIGGPGIIVLSMFDIFESINKSTDYNFNITISYFEIYNEKIRDLLKSNTGNSSLPLRYSKCRHSVVVGLSRHFPKSTEDVMKLLAEGNLRRSQSPTDRNSESSRSHAIFQVEIDGNNSFDSTKSFHSKLSLIDLAGSERASTSFNRGKLMREGANINRSLLALGNCINALCRRQKPAHIPYRDSNLTRLLSDSLGGNCNTIMVATVSASIRNVEDTANTLKYAANAKLIRLQRSRNLSRPVMTLAEARRTISVLRQRIDFLNNERRKFEKFENFKNFENFEKINKMGQKENFEFLSDDFLGFEKSGEQNLANSQSVLWELKKKKSMLEIEGKCVKRQLEYWIQRKKKLKLPETPKVIKSLRRKFSDAKAENKAIEQSYNEECSKAENFRRNLFNNFEQKLKLCDNEESKSQFAEFAKQQIEKLNWREEQLSKAIREQKQISSKLRHAASTAETHVAALFEIICLLKKRLIDEDAPLELKEALESAKEIAKIYDLKDLRKNHDIKNNLLFTPKKFLLSNEKFSDNFNFKNDEENKNETKQKNYDNIFSLCPVDFKNEFNSRFSSHFDKKISPKNPENNQKIPILTVNLTKNTENDQNLAKNIKNSENNKNLTKNIKNGQNLAKNVKNKNFLPKNSKNSVENIENNLCFENLKISEGKNKPKIETKNRPKKIMFVNKFKSKADLFVERNYFVKKTKPLNKTTRKKKKINPIDELNLPRRNKLSKLSKSSKV